jgi:hypothetical protein
MAAPNLNSLTTVTGKTAHLALTNSAADIIAAIATGHAGHVQAIFAANKTAAEHPVTVYHKAGGTSYELAPTYNVPANMTINVLDGKTLWLEEGDSLTGNSDANSQIVINAPYEDMS